MRGFVLLCCAVLAAIGVGVAFEAAATPSAYGAPGPEFVIASPASLSARSYGSGPARVTEFKGGTGLIALDVVRTTLPVSSTSVQSIVAFTLKGCDSYPRQLCGLLSSERAATSAAAPSHLTWRGALITSFCFPRVRGRVICSDNLYLSVGTTTWSLDAIGPRGQALALLETFQPVR